jgi:hypothetical protein
LDGVTTTASYQAPTPDSIHISQGQFDHVMWARTRTAATR